MIVNLIKSNALKLTCLLSCIGGGEATAVALELL